MIHRSPIRIARDYNRGLAPPVRWAHICWAATLGPAWKAAAWCFEPTRRSWAAPILLSGIFLPVLLPLDGAISRSASGWVNTHLGGDITREIAAWQQYGGLPSVLVVALLVWILDPARARRLADLAAACLLNSVATTLLKVFFSRPRPKYGDSHFFAWPFGEYPILRSGEPRLITAMSPAARAELWSMPSSHTSAAVALSVFVVALYPRLRPLCLVLVLVVAIGRTTLGVDPAHWPSDVLAGGCVGWFFGGLAVHHSLGTRVLDLLARRRERRLGPAADPLTPA